MRHCQNAERGSPKFEKAAMRWLERYLVENAPRLGALCRDHGERGETGAQASAANGEFVPDARASG